MNGCLNLIESHACVRGVVFWDSLSLRDRAAALFYFRESMKGEGDAYKSCCVQQDEKISRELRFIPAP